MVGRDRAIQMDPDRVFPVSSYNLSVCRLEAASMVRMPDTHAMPSSACQTPTHAMPSSKFGGNDGCLVCRPCWRCFRFAGGSFRHHMAQALFPRALIQHVAGIGQNVHGKPEIRPDIQRTTGHLDFQLDHFGNFPAFCCHGGARWDNFAAGRRPSRTSRPPTIGHSMQSGGPTRSSTHVSFYHRQDF